MTLRKQKAVIVDWELPQLNLYHVADTHVGAASCEEDKLKQLVEIIKEDRYACVVGGGDYSENIAPSDRRWTPRELPEPILPEHLENVFYCQALRFVKLFEPVREKFIGCILGNHETTAIRDYHINTGSIIAERLGTRYVGGTDQCGWFLLRLKSGNKTRSTIKVFVIHGWGGGELRGSDALKLQRLLWRKGADVLLMGHVHRSMAMPETVESINNSGYTTSSIRWGSISFPLVGLHGYLAKKGANAPAPGYTMVKIKRNTNGNSAKIGVEMETL